MQDSGIACMASFETSLTVSHVHAHIGSTLVRTVSILSIFADQLCCSHASGSLLPAGVLIRHAQVCCTGGSRGGASSRYEAVTGNQATSLQRCEACLLCMFSVRTLFTVFMRCTSFCSSLHNSPTPKCMHTHGAPACPCQTHTVPNDQLKGAGIGELVGVSVRSYGFVHMALCRFQGPATSAVSVWDIRQVAHKYAW